MKNGQKFRDEHSLLKPPVPGEILYKMVNHIEIIEKNKKINKEGCEMWERGWEWIRERRKWVVIIALILFAGLGFLFYPDKPQEEAFQPVAETTQRIEEKEKAETVRDVVIDLKGAVKKPGIYILPEGSRLYEAIERAGGYKENADVKQVNGAQLLTDGEGIYIPTVGEEASLPAQSQKGKVNLNKATEEELQTLPGIGPSKAKAIIQYRQEHGGFKSVDELKNVSGIGDKTFEKLKPEISV